MERVDLDTFDSEAYDVSASHDVVPTTFGEPSVFYQPSPTISVSNLGDVQRLPGGNTMVIFSTAGRIHEVDPNGNVVLSIVLEATGYGVWHSSLYASP